MGHWRSSSSSSYNRKPPLENWHSTVPSWEKKFCASVGAIPWRKLLESQKYMYLHENVLKWNDSAGKEAFDNAKRRFWADFNGLPCDISSPDPNIYIDDVDWNSSIDPELLLDLERDATVPNDEGRDEEVVILDSLLMDQSFSCTGWGDAEAATPKPYDMNQTFTPTGWGDAEATTPKHDLNQTFSPTGWGDAEEKRPKPYGPVSAAQGWGQNLHENNGVSSWGQYRAADEQNWQNDSWGWNQRSHYGGNRNWGTWDGYYNRKRENMTWSRTPPYHGNEYQMNRGRRNNRGRGRGNFAHHSPYVDKVPAPPAW
ncbi:hypothetical protein RIF29_39316 [Crotalaria pallida]|uniref:Uncharacterized protein n=1 Tax=Crotalaria pallida TaxID=3830 RepID=A0AAN9E400_CROPI